jgi:Cu2+-exporting ATPase
LVTGQKLDRFYQLRRGAVAPVRPGVFQPRDYRWLAGLGKRAEAAAGAGEASLDLDVQGVSCVGCVWLIERLFRGRPGARGIRIQAALGRLVLRWEAGVFDLVAFAEELQRFGYPVGPPTKAARGESAGLVVRLGLCAAFAMNGMLFALPAYLGMEPDFPFAGLFTALSFVFATASMAVGGTYFFARAWRALRSGVLHIDLPIALGLAAGYAGSIYAWWSAQSGFVYFDFVSNFAFLMLVGRWTQLAAIERNRNQLLGLRRELPAVDLAGDPAGGAHRSVAAKPAEALDRGDRYRVPSGGVVPVASVLLGQAGTAGLDWISGESEARVVAPGQIVESGAINLGARPMEVEALEPWAASLLARLLAVGPPEQWRNVLLERIVRGYLCVVLAAAAAGAAAWLALGAGPPAALQVLVSVLVVSCPCAIGVTLPLIDEIAVARLRHVGVFVKSETLWPRLARVRKVVFDKTGTLTLESLVLRRPAALRGLAAEARRALWALVRESRHPVASCLREAMMAGGMAEAPEAGPAEAVREQVGFGLEWRDGAGRTWRLGRPAWACGGEGGALRPAPEGDAALGCDGACMAVFSTAEEVREDAVEEAARLRRRGYEVFILSGDRAEKVAAMAQQIGVPPEAALAGMTPEAKAAWVRGIDRDGDTLMVGDGVNDSLAFEAAACRGTPAAERGVLEARADFYFLGRGLAGVRRLLETARVRRRAGRAVIAFSAAYNAAAVGVALAGAMSPLLAAVLMPASAVAGIAIAAFAMRRA